MRVIVLAITLLFATSAKADTLLVDSQFTFGNVESGAFSFHWDTITDLIIPETIQASFVGILGTFNIAGFGTSTPRHGEPFPRITWIDESNNIIQLALFDHFGAGFPNFPTYSLSNIQFWPSHDNPEWWGVAYASGASSGYLHVGPLATSVPEPSTWAMLLIGLVLLYVLACYNAKVGNVVQLLLGKW